MDYITEINNIYNEDVMNEDWKSKLATGLAIGATALGGIGKQTAQAAPKPAITQSSYSFWSDTPSMIERHEGRRNEVYKDSLGIPTIGIGYNLRNATAKEDLAKVGANLKEVLRGKQLSDDQVNELFRMSLDRALKDAKSYYPLYGYSIHKVTKYLDDGEILNQSGRNISTSNENELSLNHKRLEHQCVFEDLVSYLN